MITANHQLFQDTAIAQELSVAESFPALCRELRIQIRAGMPGSEAGLADYLEKLIAAKDWLTTAASEPPRRALSPTPTESELIHKLEELRAPIAEFFASQGRDFPLAHFSGLLSSIHRSEPTTERDLPDLIGHPLTTAVTQACAAVELLLENEVLARDRSRISLMELYEGKSAGGPTRALLNRTTAALGQVLSEISKLNLP